MSNPMYRVCVAGASGRMGQMLVDAVRHSGDCVLSGALDIAAAACVLYLLLPQAPPLAGFLLLYLLALFNMPIGNATNHQRNRSIPSSFPLAAPGSDVRPGSPLRRPDRSRRSDARASPCRS